MSENDYYNWCFKEIRKLSDHIEENAEKPEELPSLIGLINLCMNSDNPSIREKMNLFLTKKPQLKQFLSTKMNNNSSENNFFSI